MLGLTISERSRMSSSKRVSTKNNVSSLPYPSRMKRSVVCVVGRDAYDETCFTPKRAGGMSPGELGCTAAAAAEFDCARFSSPWKMCFAVVSKMTRWVDPPTQRRPQWPLGHRRWKNPRPCPMPPGQPRWLAPWRPAKDPPCARAHYLHCLDWSTRRAHLRPSRRNHHRCRPLHLSPKHRLPLEGRPGVAQGRVGARRPRRGRCCYQCLSWRCSSRVEPKICFVLNVLVCHVWRLGE